MVILHKYLKLPEGIMDFRTALSSTLHNLQHPWEVLNDARLGEKKNVNVPGAWEPSMLVCFQSEMEDGYTPFFVSNFREAADKHMTRHIFFPHDLIFRQYHMTICMIFGVTGEDQLACGG